MFFSLFAGKNPSQTSFDGNSGHVWIRIWSIRKKWIWAASHQLCKWEDATGNNLIFIQCVFCLIPSLSCPIALCAHFYTHSEPHNVHFNMHSIFIIYNHVLQEYHANQQCLNNHMAIPWSFPFKPKVHIYGTSHSSWLNSNLFH